MCVTKCQEDFSKKFINLFLSTLNGITAVDDVPPRDNPKVPPAGDHDMKMTKSLSAVETLQSQSSQKEFICISKSRQVEKVSILYCIALIACLEKSIVNKSPLSSSIPEIGDFLSWSKWKPYPLSL